MPFGAALDNRWDDARAATLGPAELLVYRSHLLGGDRQITNFGGGNTSAKLVEQEPLSGARVNVLWVKGSGGDLAEITLDGFATLYMDKLLELPRLYRGAADEDAMVGYYAHCAFNLNPRAASIDTPLHALVSYAHVDHMHPDAVIAIAASSDGRALTSQIYGNEIGWLPWIRPGFELGLQLQQFARENPAARGVILESHGLFTWGNTSKQCYSTTIEVINRAIRWLSAHSNKGGGLAPEIIALLSPARRKHIAAVVMPRIRGLISATGYKVGHFDDGPAVLEFVGSRAFSHLAALGTACPDHFLRTKIRPLALPFDASAEDEQALIARLPAAIDAYRRDYAAYYERCRRDASPPMRDPDAVIYLVPGVGMFSFAGDKTAARIASEFYINAIHIMRESSRVSTYRPLEEQAAFDIEYWLLEEAKLKRMPARKALAGRIALITGGAGGIGLASARRLLDDGACVVLTDIDQSPLDEAVDQLQAQYGKDSSVGLWSDVTDEAAIGALFRDAACHFGGIDICVSNAGIASAAAIEETSLAIWRHNMDILSTGYFLVSRECVRLMNAQDIGGSIVFIGSKNALVASPGAAAYCTAKASELHLARCLALECAPAGIRVNVVNPDAVLRGSRIWQGEWAEQRARQNHTTPDKLEEVYRNRSLLKRSVYPEDIAEAVAFLASDRAAKSTGNIINVDAGNAAAFTR